MDAYVKLCSQFDPAGGEWVHVIVEYDGEAGSLNLWVNGATQKMTGRLCTGQYTQLYRVIAMHIGPVGY